MTEGCRQIRSAIVQAIGAVALWLIANHYGEPFRITDRLGTTYELTAKIVTGVNDPSNA